MSESIVITQPAQSSIVITQPVAQTIEINPVQETIEVNNTSITTGLPGGSTGQLQYNLLGAFAGLANVNGQYLTNNGSTISWAAVAVPSAANPSATIALTAKNGTATTFLRSDGASALDVSISPTWSGTHTFSNTIAGTVTNGVVTTGSYANPSWITSLATSKLTGNFAATVSNSDSTITISPTSGAVVASLNLNHANTWLQTQTSTKFITTTTTAGALSSPGAGSGSEHFGIGSTAAGASAASIGISCTALDLRAVAMGLTCECDGPQCVAVGFFNTAVNTNDTSIGNQNRSSGGSAVTVGLDCTSTAGLAVSMGANCSASADYACAIGQGVQNSNTQTLDLGADDTYKLSLSANQIKFMALPLDRILSTTNNIDSKTTGTTLLYTVPSGKTAVILAAFVRVTTATTVVTGPQLQIEDGSANVILASTNLSTLTTTNQLGQLIATSGVKFLVTSTGTIKVNITVGATASAEVVSVDLLGYLF